jgi:hypothetical protein
MNQELKLSLEVAELDVVMNALARQPWGDVNAVIQKLLGQANNQPGPPAPPAPPAPPETAAHKRRTRR